MKCYPVLCFITFISFDLLTSYKMMSPWAHLLLETPLSSQRFISDNSLTSNLELTKQPQKINSSVSEVQESCPITNKEKSPQKISASPVYEENISRLVQPELQIKPLNLKTVSLSIKNPVNRTYLAMIWDHFPKLRVHHNILLLDSPALSLQEKGGSKLVLIHREILKDTIKVYGVRHFGRPKKKFPDSLQPFVSSMKIYPD